MKNSKKITKIIAGILITAMIFTSCMLFTSCGQREANDMNSLESEPISSSYDDEPLAAEFWLTMPGLQLTCNDLKMSTEDLLWKLFTEYRIFSISGTYSHDNIAIDGMSYEDLLLAARDGMLQDDGKTHVCFCFVCPNKTEIGINLTLIGNTDFIESERLITLYGNAPDGEAYVEDPFEQYLHLQKDGDDIFHATLNNNEWVVSY